MIKKYLKIVLLAAVLTFISFLLEVSYWEFFSHGLRENPFPWVSNVPLWYAKHFIIGLGFSFVCVTFLSSRYAEFSKKKKIVSFLPLGAAYVLSLSLGHGGTPYCGERCEDMQGLLFFIEFSILMVNTALILWIVFILFEKLFKRSLFFQWILSLFVLIITVPSFLIFFQFPRHIDDSVKRLDLSITEAMFNFSTLEETLRTKTERLPEEEWFKECQNIKLWSMGLEILGASYADRCFYIGAQAYDSLTYCDRISSLKEKGQCQKEITDLGTVEYVNGTPKLDVFWMDMITSFRGSGSKAYYLSVRNKTKETIDSAGFSVSLNDVKVGDLERVIIKGQEKTQINIHVSKEEMLAIVSNVHPIDLPWTDSKYVLKLLNEKGLVVDQHFFNQYIMNSFILK